MHQNASTTLWTVAVKIVR